MMSIRRLLQLWIWLLLGVFFCHGSDFKIRLNSNHVGDPLLRWCEAQRTWQRPFLVALLADPQVGWNLMGYNSEALFRQASEHLERLQPDLILVTGDMIQTPMASTEFQELVTAKQILEDLNIAYFLTSGNHDVFQKVSQEVLDGFVGYWHTPHYWYAVEYSNTLFVLLETNILLAYKDSNAPERMQQLAQQQLDWLETTLQTATGYDHVVPIAHHPMALRKINEDNTSLNTPRQLRRSLQKLYQSHPNITHVFGGHIHKLATITDEEGINYIAYPSTGVVLGRQPSGFALLTLNGNQPLQEQYYGYQRMPRVRPDLPDATFEVTHPSGGVEMIVNEQVCITWTSTSMANRVQVLYSTDLGASWTLIGEGPNVGVYPWTVPEEAVSDYVLVAIASVYNPAVVGASPEPNQVVTNTMSPSTTSPYHLHDMVGNPTPPERDADQQIITMSPSTVSPYHLHDTSCSYR